MGNIKNQDIKFIDGEVIDAKWVTIEEFETMLENNEIIPTIDFLVNDYKQFLDLK